MLVLFINFFINSEKSLHETSVEWFLLAIMLASTLGYELVSEKKIYFLFAEIIFTIILIIFFNNNENSLFLLSMVLLDFITFFRLKFTYCLFVFIGILLDMDNCFTIFTLDLFMIIIYFQKYVVIEKYKKYLEDFEQKEYQLKNSIDFQNNNFKKELEENNFAFENRMLEEKATLSQALHDKLGHSINGSIYQLEACKIMTDREPEKSIIMIQAVIDNLRNSMDEIRSILRREKPDKKQMALLQLTNLCKECKKKYGIDIEVKFDGEDREIPDNLWDVILDNMIEAITNALKYAKCTTIFIEITILHKVVRCSIKDNGIGCDVVKEGMGLQGMKNRTRKINGYIDVNVEEGFCINMILPIQE